MLYRGNGADENRKWSIFLKKELEMFIQENAIEIRILLIKLKGEMENILARRKSLLQSFLSVLTKEKTQRG